MPTPNFKPLGGEPTTQEIQDYIVKLIRDLNFMLSNLDTVNINRLNANIIIAGTITALQIMANTITADKMDVSELSAITANLGTIIAGSITTDAEINVGTNARIGDILYLNETDASGQKGIVFSTVGGDSAEISVLSGDMSIIVDGFITLSIGSALGLLVNKVVNAAALKSDTITNQSGVSVVFSGSSTSSTAVADSHAHGLANTDYIQCYDSGGAPTALKQWSTYAGSAGHTHTVT